MDLKMLCDEDILNYVIIDGKLSPSRTSKHILKKRGFYDYLMNRYSDNTLDKSDNRYIRETLFRMRNRIEIPPVCKICGNPVKFSYGKYPQYCSRKCSNQDGEVLKKIAESCSKSLKNAYQRNGEEIKKKRLKTLSEKYDVEISSPTPFAIKDIQQQAKDRVFEIYGVKNSFQLDWVIQKSLKVQREKSIQKQKDRGIIIERLDDDRYLVKDCCPIHGDLIYTQHEFCNRFHIGRYGVSNHCYICNPFGNHTSGMQQTIYEYIKSIYNGEIIENDKKVLNGLEIDIYLPELKLGFEFNGDYWHMNPIKYRYNDINPSTKTCAFDKWKCDINKIFLAEENGILLYHIWEYDLVNNREQLFNKISDIIENKTCLIPIIIFKRKLDELSIKYNIKNEIIFELKHVQIVFLDKCYFNKNTIDEDFIKSLCSEDKMNLIVMDKDIMNENELNIFLQKIKENDTRI